MKNNVLRNFIYSLRKVWKIDKVYILLSLIQMMLAAVNTYTYSYTIKVAIEAFETSKPFNDYIINILSMVAISLIINVLINIIKYTYIQVSLLQIYWKNSK